MKDALTAFVAVFGMIVCVVFLATSSVLLQSCDDGGEAELVMNPTVAGEHKNAPTTEQLWEYVNREAESIAPPLLALRDDPNCNRCSGSLCPPEDGDVRMVLNRDGKNVLATVQIRNTSAWWLDYDWVGCDYPGIPKDELPIPSIAAIGLDFLVEPLEALDGNPGWHEETVGRPVPWTMSAFAYHGQGSTRVGAFVIWTGSGGSYGDCELPGCAYPLVADEWHDVGTVRFPIKRGFTGTLTCTPYFLVDDAYGIEAEPATIEIARGAPLASMEPAGATVHGCLPQWGNVGVGTVRAEVGDIVEVPLLINAIEHEGDFLFDIQYPDHLLRWIPYATRGALNADWDFLDSAEHPTEPILRVVAWVNASTIDDLIQPFAYGSVAVHRFEVIAEGEARFRVAGIGLGLADYDRCGETVDPPYGGGVLAHIPGPPTTRPEEPPVQVRSCTDGHLSWLGASGRVGQELAVRMRIKSKDDVIDTIGYDLVYPSSGLTFVRTEKAGLTAPWDFWHGQQQPDPDRVIIGGFTAADQILPGQFGVFCTVYLRADAPGVYDLSLENIREDIAGYVGCAAGLGLAGYDR